MADFPIIVVPDINEVYRKKLGRIGVIYQQGSNRYVLSPNGTFVAATRYNIDAQKVAYTQEQYIKAYNDALLENLNGLGNKADKANPASAGKILVDDGSGNPQDSDKVFNDAGTTTGEVLSAAEVDSRIAGGGGSQTLAQTLVIGNITDGNDILISDGDRIESLDTSGDFASRIAIWDGAKKLQGANTGTYPDLNELSYVKGVTQPIQPLLPTTLQKQGLDAANSPSAANRFIVASDITGGLPTGEIPNAEASSDTLTQNIADGAGWVDITGISAGVTTVSTVPILIEAKINTTKTGAAGRSTIKYRVVTSGGSAVSKVFEFTITSSGDVNAGSVEGKTAALAAGTYSYKLQAQYVSGGDNLQVVGASIFVQAQQAPKGDAGVGVIAGGTAGQVLSKIDGVDYNTQWSDNSTGYSHSFLLMGG